MFTKNELMPHHIQITDIRLERLQEISDEDCIKEGMYYDITDYGDDLYWFKNCYNNNLFFDNKRDCFAALIDKTSGKGTWKKNPYVVVYEFKLID